MRESNRDDVEQRVSDMPALSGPTISRRVVLVSLAAAAALPATREAVAEAASERPPQFETIRHQFIQVRSAAPVPNIDLPCVDGSTLNLAKLRGKVVLVNFWATWCPACRVEMPMLDRLQQIKGRDRLAVVAVSVDREGRSVVVPYLRKLNLRHLTVCVDPNNQITHASGRDDTKSPFGLYGMPISYVIDPLGQVQGYMLGQADWSSEPALRLLDHYALGQ